MSPDDILKPELVKGCVSIDSHWSQLAANRFSLFLSYARVTAPIGCHTHSLGAMLAARCTKSQTGGTPQEASVVHETSTAYFICV